MDDSETTLLLLQIINDPDSIRPPMSSDTRYSQFELLAALSELKSMGLVSRREEVISMKDQDVSIPEYALGRTTVSWWTLTSEGRRHATDRRS